MKSSAELRAHYGGTEYAIRLNDADEVDEWYEYKVTSIDGHDDQLVQIEKMSGDLLLTSCSCGQNRCRHLELAMDCGFLEKPTRRTWRDLLEVAEETCKDESQLPDLAPIRHSLRQMTYIIDATCSDAIHLQVEVYSRRRKKNGQLTRLQRLAYDKRYDSELTANDKSLLEWLIRRKGYRSYGSECSSVGIRADMVSSFLRQVQRGGNLAWSIGPWQSPELTENINELEIDIKSPYQMQIEVDSAPDQWIINGQLVRDEITIPLDSVILELAEDFILTTDRLIRVPNDRSRAWLRVFQQRRLLEVPKSESRELTRKLATIRHLDWQRIPESLRPHSFPDRPGARLAINVSHEEADSRNARQRQIRGRVEFLYGPNPVSIRSRESCFQTTDGQVVLRNEEAEREVIEPLAEFDVRWLEGRYLDEADVYFTNTNFASICDHLMSAGWEIVAAGKKIRTSRGFTMQVQSEIDWFELRGEMDFGGVTVSLPELLKAARQQTKYIRLGDGSQGMLPQEWLDRYATVSTLGDVNGDAIRFVNSQALLLDALLAEQSDVDIDEKYREARDRLRRFSGIESADQPDGFQGELRAYQREGLGWLKFLSEFGFGGCLADDMGLGKTIQVLALLEGRRTRRLKKEEQRLASLVVVPKSLVFNWIEEAQRFTPKLKVLNFTGSDRHDFEGTFHDYHIVITTYGVLRREIAMMHEEQWDYAILDEAQAIKNAKAQSAKACFLLKARHRLAMTGTPVENHLGDLWSIFEFLNPGILGASSVFSSLARSSRLEVDETTNMLARALKPFILRRTKDEVLSDLPEKTEQTIFCEMDDRQQRVYDELREYYRQSLRSKVKQQGLNRSKIHVLEALLRLRQAACHPALLDKRKDVAASAKFEVLIKTLLEIVDEGHKALVFSQFTSLLSLLKSALDKEKLPYEYLDGRTRKRGERVRAFQENDEIPLFLISLKAGGHGLNLTAADYVFILDPWWNPAVEAQAVDRAHRIGQDKPVFAYRLICRGTIEEKIIELQQKKRDLADAIVKADKSFMQQLSVEDLDLLLS